MITVRQLRRGDWAPWLSLFHGYLDFYRTSLPPEVVEDVFARLVGGDPAMFGLVAIGDGDELLGLAHAVVHPNTWSTTQDCYLEDLYVLPTARGARLGEALIDELTRRGRVHGWRRLHWLTESDNGRARRLYDRVGVLSEYVRYTVDLPGPPTPTPADRPPGPAVGVFCSSARQLAPTYHEVAAALGAAIGERGWALVYGGTDTGTMATVASAASDAGAHVTGVTLQRFVDQRLDHDVCDEVVTATDLQDRKRVMIDRAEAFIALPGGFGTLDELGDVMAERRLGLMDKPIVLLDHGGFWTPLLAAFELMAHEGFATPGGYEVTPDVARAVDTIERAWGHQERG